MYLIASRSFNFKNQIKLYNTNVNQLVEIFNNQVPQ